MTGEPADPTAPPSLCRLSFLWLEITEKCNLECLHCYADSGPRRELRGQMELDDWYTVIRESADLGCRQIQFIGGEPTMHPDLASMVECASACGYTFIEVFTNATVLNNRLLRTFLASGVHIATSFYSNDPNIHDLVTGRSGSFSRTVAGIKRLVAAGLHVRAGIIETKENVGHGQRAWLFLNDLGVSDIKIDFQRGVGRGAQRLYSPEPMSQLCGECWKGKLCVTPSGQAYPCVFSRFAQVGAVRNGIRQIIDGDELLAFRTNLSNRQRTQALRDASQRRANFPADRSPARPAAEPGCNPICAPCGPETFCQPGAQKCLPSIQCNPSCSPACTPSCTPGTPCIPDTRCGPTSR